MAVTYICISPIIQNLLAAVIHSFGNWHEGCSVPCATVAHFDLELLEFWNSFGGRKPEQSMIGVVIRAGVEPYQRHELMQMFKETSQADQLPRGCLGRRVYEEVHSPTNVLLIEQWSDKAAMNSYLSSDQFRALIGAVKVLGKLVDVRVFEATSIEGLLMRLKVEKC